MSGVPVFGLHLGNTSACLAVQRDGRCDVVANPGGSRVTPAAVGWNGAEVEVGLSAKQFGERNKDKAVLKGNKIIFCKDRQTEAFEEIISNSGRDGVKIVSKDERLWYEVKLEDKTKRVSPAEVQYLVMKYMHDIATSHSNDGEFSTVLTVPLDMSEDKREETKKCAEKAGFTVVQVISEPAAACLAYSLGQLDPTESYHALVFRVGGMSLTASLVFINAGFISVVASVDRQIGGDRITKLAADFIADEFQRKYKADPRETKRGKQKLLSHGENVKHILSTLETASCYIESLYEGIDFNCNVTRMRFDNEVGKILNEYINPINDVLSMSGIESDRIDKVIFCGGTSKIPRLQKSVGAMFKNAEMLFSLNPDEVLSVGAASHAALVAEDPWQGDETSPELNALNSTLVFQVNDGEEDQVLIPRLTPIPVRKSHHFDKTEASIAVKIMIKSTGGEKLFVAKLSLSDLPADAKVTISGHVYRDHSLHLVLQEKTSNKCDQVTIAAPQA